MNYPPMERAPRAGQGLGHAVLCAKPLVGDATFAVVLPDVLIDDAAANLEQENLAAMVREFERTGVSQILIELIPEEDVKKYGIVDVGGLSFRPGENAMLTDIMERPALNEAPSNLSIVGRYVFSAHVMNIWPTCLLAPARRSS